MATNTILNRSQVPLATAFKDVLNVFTVLPEIPTTTPTLDAQVASKKYVDDRMSASISGLELKQSVRATTTASVGTYTATAGAAAKGQITAAPSTLDGVVLAAGNRILVKDHATAAANGIYVVTTVGTGANGVWDRSLDFDSDAEASPNSFAFVEEGTALADTAWVLITNGPITLGGASGTALTWTQFAGAGVGVSSIAIASTNGLAGTSSGGNTPTVTLRTTLGAGPVRSDGANAFVLGTINLATEVNGVLTPTYGGTGVNNGTATVTLAGAVVFSTNGATFASPVAALTHTLPSVSGTLVNTTVTALTALVSVGTITTGTWNAGVVAVAYGGTGVNTITGLVKGNGTTAMSAATAADVVGVIGATAVTNATNAVNVAVTNDVATATPVFLSWVGANSGNQSTKVSSTALSFVPSTGVLSATGFSGSGAALTGLSASNISGTLSSAVLGNSTLYVGTTAIALNRASANLALTGISSVGYVNGANTATLSAGVMAGNIALTLPLLAGSLVGTGDTGTVTNNMLAGSIAITKLVSSTISGISLGNNLATLTIGTDLSGASYNGSTGITIAVVSASINTLSTLVKRDASGNFAAGTITANLTGTATNVSNSVTFNNSGSGAASGTTFNGSAAQTISWNTVGAQAPIVGNGNYFAGVLSAYSGTATYPIGNTPLANTLMVFVNGILQNVGAGNDYTVSGSNVIFTFTPLASDVVLVTYFK
jgi:hypothetical protein